LGRPGEPFQIIICGWSDGRGARAQWPLAAKSLRRPGRGKRCGNLSASFADQVELSQLAAEAAGGRFATARALQLQTTSLTVASSDVGCW